VKPLSVKDYERERLDLEKTLLVLLPCKSRSQLIGGGARIQDCSGKSDRCSAMSGASARFAEQLLLKAISKRIVYDEKEDICRTADQFDNDQSSVSIPCVLPVRKPAPVLTVDPPNYRGKLLIDVSPKR